MATTEIKGDRVISDVNAAMPKILAVIRGLESGNDYSAQSQYATASGAYQFIDATWKSLANSVPGAAQYVRAKDAPKSVQDAVAGLYVKSILASHNMQLASVPVTWYYPAAWNNAAILDTVPGTGNKLTVRQYAEKWLSSYGVLGGEGIGSNAQDVVQDIPVISSLVDWTETAARFLAALMNPTTWMRVSKVVGGTALLGIGLYVVSGRNIVQDAVSATVPL